VGRFSTVTGDNLWRYDPLSDGWEILADLPGARAAGAAVFLHGRVWIVGGVGVGLDMQAYDVQSGEWESFPGAVGVPVDHMQAVAFENEIWWLGGRDDQTSNEVRIWNPVTRVWRVGPSLQFRRAGFAARVVQGQIMVAGGERTELVPFQLVPSMELFASGAAGWVPGPPPPIAVHGTTGAAAGGEFILVGGSTVAGTTSSNRATQIYAPAEPGVMGSE
jgi:N-acetylneuraminic acid mutarotase